MGGTPTDDREYQRSNKSYTVVSRSSEENKHASGRESRVEAKHRIHRHRGQRVGVRWEDKIENTPELLIKSGEVKA